MPQITSFYSRKILLLFSVTFSVVHTNVSYRDLFSTALYHRLIFDLNSLIWFNMVGDRQILRLRVKEPDDDTRGYTLIRVLREEILKAAILLISLVLWREYQKNKLNNHSWLKVKGPLACEWNSSADNSLWWTSCL